MENIIPNFDIGYKCEKTVTHFQTFKIQFMRKDTGVICFDKVMVVSKMAKLLIFSVTSQI